jgi:hypothetical protein
LFGFTMYHPQAPTQDPTRRRWVRFLLLFTEPSPTIQVVFDPVDFMARLATHAL